MKSMKTIGNSIDILGDSFSCPKSKVDVSDSWMELLEKKYNFEVKNTSLHGVGAQWCLEKFMGFTKFSDFLLICLPDMNRLWLEYLSEEKMSDASMIYSVMNKKSFDLPEMIDDEIADQSNKIFKDYESFYSTGLHRILEVLFVSFIFTKHKKYKKILKWPSSGNGYPFRNYNYTLEVPNNVHIVSRCLNLISYCEKRKVENNDVIFFENDTRNNHLSFENHVILADQIMNFFINKIVPNPSQFKSNFL